ncbi:MAG: LysR substrate-binding domain-containing protein, partial [Pseudomonadota bacterium]
MYDKWLQAFHYVVKLRGFTDAAEFLHVGQPTISTHVGNLEKHFGVELLHRKKRRIQLTPEGENLYAITSDIFGHQQEAIDYLRSLQTLNVGELKFCAVRPYDVMELLSALRERWPGIKCSVQLRSSERVIEDLKQFGSDVGIVSREFDDPEIHSVFYRRHKVFVVVNRAHRLADRKHIKLADLDGEDMVVRTARSTTQAAFDQAMKDAGLSQEQMDQLAQDGFDPEAVQQALQQALEQMQGMSQQEAQQMAEQLQQQMQEAMQQSQNGENAGDAAEQLARQMQQMSQAMQEQGMDNQQLSEAMQQMQQQLGECVGQQGDLQNMQNANQRMQ